MRILATFLFFTFMTACSSVSVPPGETGARTGPVIKDFGPAYAVPQGSYNLVPGETYKVVMDIGNGPENAQEINRGIESAARFINLHAQNGIDASQLELAIVLHGSAARTALSDDAYVQRYGSDNINRALLEALGEAGVAVYLCGQSAAHNGFEPDQLLPQVSLAASAMTVHVRLQQEGYRAILF